MGSKVNPFRTILPLFLVGSLMLGLGAMARFPSSAQELPPSAQGETHVETVPEQTDASRIYLPALFHRYPWISPFGVESKYTMTWPLLMTKAVDLRANWVRLNQRISWRDLQPAEGAAIDWSQLADFEDELRALKANGMTPMVIVDNHPEWATIEAYGADGQRSWCAAIRPDKYNAFAQFMRELVNRYKVDEFDVHYWEPGNEPDPLWARFTRMYGFTGQRVLQTAWLDV